MPLLVDSNVLIFSIQQSHPWHEESIKAVEVYLAANETASSNTPSKAFRFMTLGSSLG